MDSKINLEELDEAVQFTLMYGNNDAIVKADKQKQEALKKKRRENANCKEVNWAVTDVEEFKKRLGRKWQNNISNFAILLNYAKEQLQHSMPNEKTKQKWTMADEPAISLSKDHTALKTAFADINTVANDYIVGGKLDNKIRNVLKVALKSNFIYCVDNTYSPKNAKVSFTKLYKFNPHVANFVIGFKTGQKCGNSDELAGEIKNNFNQFSVNQSTFNDSLLHKGVTFTEGADLSQFFSTYKLDKLAKPMSVEHTPEFIKEVVKAKYSPLVIYPEYKGDSYMDAYNLNYKVALTDKGELKKISCREWTPFTQTTKEQKEGLTFRGDICNEYFGENTYDWDVNGSIYRMTAAINNKKLDNDTDVYEQLWPFDKSLFTPVLRKSFKHLCMCAYMTRKQDDFIKGVAKMCGKKLPDEVKEYCNIIWNHMRELIGESYRTEALFAAGCFEKIVKFALVRRFKNTILQCYDCFYGAQYDIGRVSKKIYDEILSNEDALDVVRDVLAGRKPKSTLQEIFKNII